MGAGRPAPAPPAPPGGRRSNLSSPHAHARAPSPAGPPIFLPKGGRPPQNITAVPGAVSLRGRPRARPRAPCTGHFLSVGDVQPCRSRLLLNRAGPLGRYYPCAPAYTPRLFRMHAGGYVAAPHTTSSTHLARPTSAATAAPTWRLSSRAPLLGLFCLPASFLPSLQRTTKTGAVAAPSATLNKGGSPCLRPPRLLAIWSAVNGCTNGQRRGQRLGFWQRAVQLSRGRSCRFQAASYSRVQPPTSWRWREIEILRLCVNYL